VKYSEKQALDWMESTERQKEKKDKANLEKDRFGVSRKMRQITDRS
jgi:hypothetical protein